MNETKLQHDLQVMLRNRGFYPLKIHGDMYQRAGSPDILACGRGVFYAFECKAANGKLKRKQWRELNRINNAGGVALVVYSVLQVEELLSRSYPDQLQLSRDNLEDCYTEGLEPDGD